VKREGFKGIIRLYRVTGREGATVASAKCAHSKLEQKNNLHSNLKGKRRNLKREEGRVHAFQTRVGEIKPPEGRKREEWQLKFLTEGT